MSEVSGQDFQTWNKLHGRDFLKYFLILELLENNSTQLSYIYPPLQDKDKHLINSQIPQFCFPDAETFPRKIEKNESKFFFTLKGTTIMYGFCERENVQNSKTKLTVPYVYCFLTDYAYQNFYSSILSFITKHCVWSRHKSEDQMNLLLDHILLQPISRVSSSQQIPYPQLVSHDMDSIPLKFLTDVKLFEKNPLLSLKCVDSDTVFDSECFSRLRESLDTMEIILIYFAMLLERRMIFVSSNLSVLSECIHSFSAMLWPMTWQQVYIPILPPSMLDYVCAPMPFVVGILSIHLDRVKEMPLEKVWFVNLDKKGNAIHGDISILDLFPDTLTLPLIYHFQQAFDVKTQGKINIYSDHVTEEKAIFQFISEIICNVPRHINQGQFNTEQFITTNDIKLQPLLRELVSSQLFNMYKNQFRIEVIDDRKVAEFLTKQTMDKMHNSKGVLNSLNFGSLDFIAKEGAIDVLLDNGDRDHRYLALNHTCLITMENSKYEREVISLLAIESIEKFISTQLFGFEICFSKDTALVPDSNIYVFKFLTEDKETELAWFTMINYFMSYCKLGLLSPLIPTNIKNYSKKSNYAKMFQVGSNNTRRTSGASMIPRIFDEKRYTLKKNSSKNLIPKKEKKSDDELKSFGSSSGEHDLVGILASPRSEQGTPSRPLRQSPSSRDLLPVSKSPSEELFKRESSKNPKTLAFSPSKTTTSPPSPSQPSIGSVRAENRLSERDSSKFKVGIIKERSLSLASSTSSKQAVQKEKRSSVSFKERVDEEGEKKEKAQKENEKQRMESGDEDEQNS